LRPASPGIGSALARRLACAPQSSAGASGGPAASVVLSADNEGDLQKTLDEIQKGSGGGGGGRLSAAPADALDPQAVSPGGQDSAALQRLPRDIPGIFVNVRGVAAMQLPWLS
jgi:NAD(P)-dependent dehydrogenase (short-subunit alcohol dehydrogenase family)